MSQKSKYFKSTSLSCTKSADLDFLGEEAAKIFKIDPFSFSVESRNRSVPLVEARFCVWNALRERGLTLVTIGKLTGRDHKAVLYGLRKYKVYCEIDKIFAKKAEAFGKKIKNEPAKTLTN